MSSPSPRATCNRRGASRKATRRRIVAALATGLSSAYLTVSAESREDFQWATAEVETQASKPADPDEGGPLRCPVSHASPQRSTKALAPRS
jgi:hypothetical protein